MLTLIKPLTIRHASRRRPAWPLIPYIPTVQTRLTSTIRIWNVFNYGKLFQRVQSDIRCATNTRLNWQHVPKLSSCNVVYYHISWQTPCSSANAMPVYQTLDVWLPSWHQPDVSMATCHLYNTGCGATGISMKGKRMTLTWRHLVARCFVTIVMGILASWCVKSSYCLIKVVRRLTHLQYT